MMCDAPVSPKWHLHAIKIIGCVPSSDCTAPPPPPSRFSLHLLFQHLLFHLGSPSRTSLPGGRWVPVPEPFPRRCELLSQQRGGTGPLASASAPG